MQYSLDGTTTSEAAKMPRIECAANVQDRTKRSSKAVEASSLGLNLLAPLASPWEQHVGYETGFCASFTPQVAQNM